MYQVTIKTMDDGVKHKTTIHPSRLERIGDNMRNAVLEATLELFGEEARFLFADVVRPPHQDVGIFPGALAYTGDDGTLGQVFLDVLAEVKVVHPSVFTRAMENAEKALILKQATHAFNNALAGGGK